jgi:uroporphyrinogen-III synthase
VQFRFLLEVAGEIGEAEALLDALNERVIVGAVGPVCASALRAGGVVPDVLPASPNSASLVGAVADYFELMVKE